MSEADLYATAASYEALVEALKRRAGELEISYSDLEAIAGLPAGFAGKVFGPSQTKRFGHLSLFNTLPALGLRLTLAVDPEALRRYAQRGLKRNGKQARVGNFSQQRVSKRIISRVQRYFGLRSARKRKIARLAVEAKKTAASARQQSENSTANVDRSLRRADGRGDERVVSQFDCGGNSGNPASDNWASRSRAKYSSNTEKSRWLWSQARSAACNPAS
jgi:hypothetical protein